MAGKKITQLDTRVPITTDLMIVGDPASGNSFKSTVSALINVFTADLNTTKKRFTVGDAGFPGDGDSNWTDADFLGANLWAYRNGLLLDWVNPGDGSAYYTHTGNTVTFYPALTTSEKIQILIIKL